MRVLTIRFDGLCCHIKPPNGRPAVARRTILIEGSHHQHIPYVECYPGNLDTKTRNPNETRFDYTRDYVDYSFIRVDNSRIALQNTILSTSFTVSPSFEQNIPKLSWVCPSFKDVKTEFLEPVIGPNKVAAFFDMSAGVLSSGPVEPNPTEFDPMNLWPRRRLGQWAQLDIEIDGAAPILVITDLATGKDRVVYFEDDTNLLTFGNQVMDDILGLPVTGSRDGHFEMYYDLAAHVAERPKPRSGGLGLGTGCTNSGFP
jgi:hypothetical protein